ncbi:tetratricopeptide repeat protein [bacterium]|nr:tetratricopeptide repeat protein [bacterium]
MQVCGFPLECGFFLKTRNLKAGFLSLTFFQLFFSLMVGCSIVQAQTGQIDQLISKAEYFLSVENVVTANAFLSQAHGISPNHPRVKEFSEKLKIFVSSRVNSHLQAGDFFASNHDVPRAIEEYNAVLRISPSNKTALEKLNDIRKIKIEVKKYQNQGVTIDQSTGHFYDSQSYSALFALLQAKEAYSKGDLEKAVQILDDLLKRDGKFQEAGKLKEKILEEVKFRTLVSEAESEKGHGNYSKSLEYFGRAIALNPNRADLRVSRGLANLRLGAYQAAQDDFFVSLDMKTPLEKIQAYLAEAYAGKGEFLKALALSKKPAGNTYLFPVKVRGSWYISAFPYASMIGFLETVLLFFAFFWCWRQFDKVLGRKSVSDLYQIVRCIIGCYFLNPLSNASKIKTIGQTLNNPWWNFFCGLVLLNLKKPDEAQNLFQGSLSSQSLAPRANFFLGMIRAEIDSDTFRHNLEQVIILGLNSPPEPWTPKFLFKLEKSLLENYRERCEKSDLMKLSHKMACALCGV